MNTKCGKAVTALFAVVVAASGLALAGEVTGDKISLTIGSGITRAHPVYPIVEEFDKELRERSNNTMEIVIAMAGALGSDREIIESVINGGVEMMFMADISVGTVVPKVGYVNLPYLFKTREDAEKIYLYGWMGEKFREALLEKNLVVVGDMMESDFRWMSNSVRPIQKPEDLRNLKMRVVESPMYVKFFEGIGTQPVGMSVSEVAAALQQRVIDGQDNGPVQTYYYGFYEFQPYMTKTNHAYAAIMFYVNKDVLESMSESQRELFLELATKYSRKGYEHVKRDIDRFCEEMDAKGMKILETTPELSDFMQAAAKKVWADQAVTRFYDQDVMKRILSEMAQ